MKTLPEFLPFSYCGQTCLKTIVDTTDNLNYTGYAQFMCV